MGGDMSLALNELSLGYSHELTNPEKIEQLESEMLEMEQAECPVKHIFGGGVYIREVSIPAGVFSVGHYQKTTHMNHMVKGRVLMLKDDGTTEIVEAPKTFTSEPGRKIGLILDDMVWQNIYPTNETDISILESAYLDKSDGWKADSKMKSQIEYIMREADREDYNQMLIDLSVSHETVLTQSENTLDQIPMPSGDYKVMVSDSYIQGKGLFATSKIKDGDIIAPARLDGMRTPAGRFTNHGTNPNARMIMNDNGDIMLTATRDINGCLGGELGEEIIINYRQAVKTTRGGDLCQQ